MISSIV
ncbi:hypothetical protein LINPERHAP2_LOCUS16080 [Linum perenne]